MKLWISNLPPNNSDEDVRAFVRKYTQVEIDAIIRIDGDGSRPGVLIEIGGATEMMLTAIKHRLDRMYWDQHELVVHILSFADQG
jgi:RNA recognition motif-containing protein